METSMIVIGMGLAAIGLAGASLGMGYMVGKIAESLARNPHTKPELTKIMFIGLAMIESIALYGFVIALLIMGRK